MNLVRLTALMLEDSATAAELLAFELEACGFELVHQRVAHPNEFVAAITRRLPDVIIASAQLKSLTPFDAMRLLREQRIDVPFIVVEGRPCGEEQERERDGVASCLLRERPTQLGLAVQKALFFKPVGELGRVPGRAPTLPRFAAGAREACAASPESPAEDATSNEPPLIVGESPALQRVLSLVRAVAPTKASVLIQGESGTGKELIARAVHAQSERAARPLVKVNCASIPTELFESEFFGHVKGAFTGAHRNRIGRFELADGGTLFLDEVGEIPLEMQAKLLRVLQEGEFERVGDDRTLSADVRVIAASNRDLAEEVAEGRFRSDLYYRLSVFPLHLPPLRERKEDILPLARFFLGRACAELGRPPLVIGPEHAALLEAQPWPGNIRELEHVISRAAILSRSSCLALDVSAPCSEKTSDKSRPSESRILTAAALRDLERRNLIAALEQSGWRVSGAGGAAGLLGLHPSTLRDRMKALGVHRRAS